MRKIIACSVFLSLSFQVYADEISSADPARMSRLADSIVSDVNMSSTYAKGAAQVSQLADQAQLKLSQMLIRQNDEIVTLLREIAKKK